MDSYDNSQFTRDVEIFRQEIKGVVGKGPFSYDLWFSAEHMNSDPEADGQLSPDEVENIRKALVEAGVPIDGRNINSLRLSVSGEHSISNGLQLNIEIMDGVLGTLEDEIYLVGSDTELYIEKDFKYRLHLSSIREGDSFATKISRDYKVESPTLVCAGQRTLPVRNDPEYSEALESLMSGIKGNTSVREAINEEGNERSDKFFTLAREAMEIIKAREDVATPLLEE